MTVPPEVLADEQPAATGGLCVWTETAEATERLGAIIGAAVAPGDELQLTGEMGAGKTTLVRGITIGAECEVLARSPTFVIVAEYPGPVPISHCDLYRVGSSAEAAELALEERLARGVLVIEWPENGGSSRHLEALMVRLIRTELQSRRLIEIDAVGPTAQSLLTRVQRGLTSWLRASGAQDAGLASRDFARSSAQARGDAQSG